MSAEFLSRFSNLTIFLIELPVFLLALGVSLVLIFALIRVVQGLFQSTPRRKP